MTEIKGHDPRGRKIIPYEEDLQDWLQTPEHAAEHLTAVLEEDDFDTLLLALRDVAKAAVAERAQIRRKTL
ncbi:MAG: hypothetical protein WDA20_14990 [Desulfuromonadales bacterium]